MGEMLKTTQPDRNKGRATRGKSHGVPAGNRVGEPPTLSEFGLTKTEAMNARWLAG
jgi:hypothetical protein